MIEAEVIGAGSADPGAYQRVCRHVDRVPGKRPVCNETQAASPEPSECDAT